MIITVVATDRASLDSGIEAAVQSMIEIAAEEKRRGILVSRRSPGNVTIRLSPDVPFGEPFELNNW